MFSEDTIVVPEQGDIIEKNDGSRSIVMFVEDPYVYLPDAIERAPNTRGKSKLVSCLKKEEWPIEGAYLYRDSSLIYPQKNYKLKVLLWLNNILLKK